MADEEDRPAEGVCVIASGLELGDESLRKG